MEGVLDRARPKARIVVEDQIGVNAGSGEGLPESGMGERHQERVADWASESSTLEVPAKYRSSTGGKSGKTSKRR